MAAYHKVEVSLNTNAVEVGIPSPQTVNVVVPTIGPAGPVGSVGPVGPQGPQGVPGTGLEVLTTQGDLLYQGASTGQRLPIGTSGQILRVANGIPSWGNESGAVTSVNGETGAVILDGSEIESSANDVRAAFTMSAFDDGDGIYYPLPDLFINTKPVYSTTSGYSVFFENARWHITDGSPITANIIESSDNDNAAWPWLSAWSGSVLKAKLADVVGRARDTFLFVGDNLKVGTSSGLPLKTGSGGEVQAGAFGTGAGQFSEGNHTHGNLTNDGKIGTTANLPLKTGTNGVIEAGSFGTAAGSFCEGNDARLSDDRDPNLHAASHLPEGADEIFDQSLNTDDSVTFDDVTADVVVCAAFADASENTQLQFDDGIHRLINNLTETVTVSDSDASFAVPIAFGGEDAATNAATTRDNLGLGDAAVEDTTAFAASGSITTSGLTQATARILGRTTASTGSIEEIQIGSGLSLSAGELSSTVSAGIPATIVDAKGDLILGSAADTVARLPVGATNGHALVVDSAETLGMKWAAVSGVTSGSVDNAVLRADGTGGAASQPSDLIIEDATTSTANNVAITNQHSGQTNSSLVLSPKGTGAIIIGPKPDGTTTGGNARGANSFDFVTGRSGATQVASGQNAFAFGARCTASANYAVAFGFASNASGEGAFAAGESSASQIQSTAFGKSIAQGIYSCAVGSSTAQGRGSFSAGENNTATGDYSVAFGVRATAGRHYQFSQSSGRFAANGDVQNSRFHLFVKTTNATATEMTMDGTRLSIPSGRVMGMIVNIVGAKSDGSAVAHYVREVCCKNVAGTSSLVGAVTTIGADQEDNASTDVAITISDANDAVTISVTGIASETWRWCATVDCSEFAYGT